MAEILHLKLNIDDKEAFIDLKKLEKELEKIRKVTSKPPKVDSSSFKKYKEQAALAASVTTQLGRQLDQLTAKYGADSTQVNKFVSAQLKANKAAKIQKKAILDLKKAMDGGVISQTRYRLEAQKLAKTQSLYVNKLKGATPIRRLGKDLKEIGFILSNFNPLMGGAVGQVATFSDSLMNARVALGGTAEGLQGIQGKTKGLLGGINPLVASFVALGAAVVGVGLKFANFAKQSREVSKQIESQIISTASVFNTTLQFKDELGKPLEIDKNFAKSLEQADAVVQQLLIDSAKLTNVEFQDLIGGLTVAAPYLGQLGATGVKDQAEAVGSLVTALKTLKPTATEIEQATEIRAILNGDFGSSRSDLARNLLARTGKTKDQMKALFDEAKKAGTGVQFLNEQFKPLIDSVKLGSNSLSNLESVLKTVKDVSMKETGDQFKGLSKIGVLDLTLGVEEGRASGLFKALGQSWKNALETVTPLMKPLQDAWWNMTETVSHLVSFLGVFGRVASPLLSSILGGLNNLWQPLNALIELSVSFFDLLLHRGNEVEAQTTDSWKRISDSITNAFRLGSGIIRAFGEDSGAVMLRLKGVFKNALNTIPAYFKIAVGISLMNLSGLIDKLPPPLKKLLGIESGASSLGMKIRLEGLGELGRAEAGLAEALQSLKEFAEFTPAKKGLSNVTSKTKEATEEDDDSKKKEKERKALETAQKQLETAQDNNKLKQEELNLLQQKLRLENESFVKQQALNNLSKLYQSEQSSVDLSRVKIQQALKLKQLTERESQLLLYNLDKRELELDYNNDLLKLQAKKNSLIEQEALLRELEANKASESLLITSQIKELEAKKENLTGSKLVKLETELVKLYGKLAEIQVKADQKIQDAQQKVTGLRGELDIDRSAIEDKKNLKEEKLKADYNTEAIKSAQSQRKALIEGAKEIKRQITSAFEDGKITLEEGFQIFENILGKLKSGLSGGASEGLGLGALFGQGSGGSSKYDSSSLSRNADGVFSAFNKLTGQTESLGTSCGIAAKEAVGLSGGFKGIGGMFKGLFKGIGGMFKGEGMSGFSSLLGGAGGAGGMASMVVGGLGALAGVGQTVFGMFSSRRKKKKEEEMRRKIKAVEKMYKAAMYSLTQMENDFQDRMDEFNRVLSDINREIRKIDVNTSLFMGQQVIEKTRQQIQATIDQIGAGTELIVREEQGTGYVYAVERLGEAATGLYAERNKQISLLMQHQQFLWGEIAAGAKFDYGDKVEEQIGSISEKIREINENFNSQIDSMIENRKDLEEQLEQAIEQQKTNFLYWEREFKKATLSLQFGDGVEPMFDSMIEAVDKIREVMISGLDPQMASFLTTRIREKAQNTFKNQYRDYLEGTSNSYLDELRALQDDLLAIHSEGKISGQIKRTKADKLAALARREADLREAMSQEDATSKLEEFGIALDNATDPLEAITRIFNEQVNAMTGQVQQSQYRAIDAVNVNVITPPEVTAKLIQDKWSELSQTQLSTALRV